MEALKWLLSAFCEDWAVKATSALIFPFFIYFCLWTVGKEGMVLKGSKRLCFGIAAFITAFVLINLLTLAGHQLNDIRIGVTNVRGAMRSGIQRMMMSEEQGKTIAGFSMRVVNSGWPSVAWAWALTVELPTKQRLESRKLIILSDTNSGATSLPTALN